MQNVERWFNEFVECFERRFGNVSKEEYVWIYTRLAVHAGVHGKEGIGAGGSLDLARAVCAVRLGEAGEVACPDEDSSDYGCKLCGGNGEQVEGRVEIPSSGGDDRLAKDDECHGTEGCGGSGRSPEKCDGWVPDGRLGYGQGGENECVVEGEVVLGELSDTDVDERGLAPRESGTGDAESWLKRERLRKQRVKRAALKRKKAEKKEVSKVPEWRRGAPAVSELRSSLERKWAAENRLKTLEAERKVKLLESEDLEAVKRLQEKRVKEATDRTMAKIEKTHAYLKSTGNVPGLPGGGMGSEGSVPGLSEGGTISPNSSISEKEVREMMKALEDLKVEYEAVKREVERKDNRITELVNGKAAAERMERARKKYDKVFKEPTAFSVDEFGGIAPALLVELGDHVGGMEFLETQSIEDGKFVVSFNARKYAKEGDTYRSPLGDEDCYSDSLDVPGLSAWKVRNGLEVKSTEKVFSHAL